MRYTKNKQTIIIFLSIILVLVMSISPLLGQYNFNFEIITSLRIPRVLTAFLVGAGLSICGLIYQSMFVNPLADPYILGVSSGALTGVAVYNFFGLTFVFFSFNGQTLFSFAGALLSMVLVYSLAKIKNRDFNSNAVLLLVGVSLALFFSGITMLIQLTADSFSAIKILHSTVGGLEVIGYSTPLNIFPLLLIGMVVTYFYKDELNLLTLGEELAVSRGVNCERVRKIFFIISSLMTAAITSECGSFAFIGIIVPHMARSIIGIDHKYLIPTTVVVGGGILVICDTIARLILTNSELPVGIITTLFGGPFFLYLILRKSNNTFSS